MTHLSAEPHSSSPSRSPLQVGVIGTGSLGKEHARLYAELAQSGNVRFQGVFDTNSAAAEAIASKYQVRAFPSIQALAQACQAVSVVTPTQTHFNVSQTLLESGCHVLVEKPITNDLQQANALVELAQKHQRILQVGHIERFNPVFTFLRSAATSPRFIETHRLSPYPARSTDIGVVLDLMIHDLDVVLAFVHSPVQRVSAVGIPVLSQSEDIANARLEFANGCVANLTASRISAERMRKIRVFSGGSHPSYISLDYRAQEGYLYRLARSDEPESSLLKKLLSAKDSAIVSEFGGKKIVREPVPIRKEEPLRVELESFIQCAQEQLAPVVSGEAGRRALELATEITQQIRRSPTPAL